MTGTVWYNSMVTSYHNLHLLDCSVYVDDCTIASTNDGLVFQNDDLLCDERTYSNCRSTIQRTSIVVLAVYTTRINDRMIVIHTI